MQSFIVVMQLCITHYIFLWMFCTSMATEHYNSKAGQSTVKNNSSFYLIRNTKSMADGDKVVNYEEVVKKINQPKKLIIDVRNPDEVNTTGKIPSSINIPLPQVEASLSSSDEDFQRLFQKPKPGTDDELIFYCRSGNRAIAARDKALEIGYSKSKSYLGSWQDWSKREQ